MRSKAPALRTALYATCERQQLDERARLRKLTLELGLLEHLDLADEHVVQGVDVLTALLNVLADAPWNAANAEDASRYTAARPSLFSPRRCWPDTPYCTDLNPN